MSKTKDRIILSFAGGGGGGLRQTLTVHCTVLTLPTPKKKSYALVQATVGVGTENI